MPTLLEKAQALERPVADTKDINIIAEKTELAMAWARGQISTKDVVIVLYPDVEYQSGHTTKGRFILSTIFADAVKAGLLVESGKK